MNRHHKGVHENIKQARTRDYRCKFCKEILKNKYQKEKHLALVHHDGLKPKRTCQLCDLHFELFDEFRNHVEQHVDAFICLICGEDNPDQIAKDLHMESLRHINIDLRRFSCDFCGHKLFNKIQLKVSSFDLKPEIVLEFIFKGSHEKAHEGNKLLCLRDMWSEL